IRTDRMGVWHFRCRYRKRNLFSSVAAYMLIGILTKPKLIEPFHIVCTNQHLTTEIVFFPNIHELAEDPSEVNDKLPHKKRDLSMKEASFSPFENYEPLFPSRHFLTQFDLVDNIQDLQPPAFLV